MYRLRKAIIQGSLLLLMLTMGACNRNSMRESYKTVEDFQDIIWYENEDGSHTFTNLSGMEGTIYAWSVLDQVGETIYRTNYSSDNTFTYDLEENRDLIVKGFTRNGTEEDYEQLSIKVTSAVVLGRTEYQIVEAEVPDNALELIESVILRYAYRDDAASAEEVVMGTAYGEDISMPIDWSCVEVEDSANCFRLHTLTFLDNLYTEYKKSENREYIELIMDYIVDWAKSNPDVLSENEWAWGDDIVARRVFRMSFYYYLYGDMCNKEERELIEKSLYEQTQLLLSETFYTAKHNHGMHQDFGVLVYALLIADESEKGKYISTALSRTGEYLDYCFTTDGVHKEHSPLYMRDVLLDLVLFQELTGGFSPEFYQKTKNVIKESNEYLLQITKPNGDWPSIGDSDNTVSSCVGRAEENRGYLYFISGGEQGDKPEEEMVFEDAGYAVMRSSWEDEAGQATWMMFLASTFSSTHKHSDDLSFLLYHKGDLFVEAGKRNYDYKNEMTQYAYSSYGHNVMLADGEPYPVKIGESGAQSILPTALETCITDYDLESEIKSVTGVQKRFENVIQHCTLSYDKENDVVIVKDEVNTAEDMEATFLYHIAEGVTVETTETGWELYRENELVAVVEVKCEKEIELRTVMGEAGSYPYCTWIFDGEEEPSKGALLMVDVECSTGINNINMSISLK